MPAQHKVPIMEMYKQDHTETKATRLLLSPLLARHLLSTYPPIPPLQSPCSIVIMVSVPEFKIPCMIYSATNRYSSSLESICTVPPTADLDTLRNELGLSQSLRPARLNLWLVRF